MKEDAAAYACATPLMADRQPAVYECHCFSDLRRFKICYRAYAPPPLRMKPAYSCASYCMVCFHFRADARYCDASAAVCRALITPYFIDCYYAPLLSSLLFSLRRLMRYTYFSSDISHVFTSATPFRRRCHFASHVCLLAACAIDASLSCHIYFSVIFAFRHAPIYDAARAIFAAATHAMPR